LCGTLAVAALDGFAMGLHFLGAPLRSLGATCGIGRLAYGRC
jgi:hypothetical protein